MQENEWQGLPPVPGLADGPPIHRMDFLTLRALGPEEVTLLDFNLIDCVDRKLEVAQHVKRYPCKGQ